MKLHAAFGVALSACLVSRVPSSRSPALKTVTITEFRFSPAELSVARGDTLVWTNQDAFLHTTTADSGAWSSPELGRAARFTFVASRAGRFDYHCTAHPVMRATVVVRE
jgi:plastocyanin